MITARDVVSAVGPAVFTLVEAGDPGRAAADVFLAEHTSGHTGDRDDVVLGLGLGSPAQAVELVHRCVEAGSSGLVLPVELAQDDGVRRAAAEAGLLLVGLQPDISWAHVVWMLRGVLDRAAAPDAPVAGDAGVHNDLFVLADAVAAIIDAPVTVEDNQSRVLAYSSGQNRTDPARVSTIVGRRVPPEVVAHFRAQGVFRRLARSNEPFLIPEGPDGTLPRFVVPVRAGDEWLGSIWAVVDGPVQDAVVAEIVNAASVLALHLLRLRAQADVARRNAAGRLRAALRSYIPGSVAELALPTGPWRVVALGTPDAGADLGQQLDLWATTFRRHSWADPQLTDLEGGSYAVVSTHTGPGSWPWLSRVVDQAHTEDPRIRAAAGGPADTVSELPRSRAEAAETLSVVGAAAVTTHEESWAALTVRRATAALNLAAVGGPVLALLRHDEEHGTSYVETLARQLAFPGEPRRAAGALHIHPNTLRHRMKRMAGIVDLDLSDPTQRLALQLQLQVEAVRRP